jgi:hypothetical protein
MFDGLEHYLFDCFIKSHFGVSCPGCGLQRAFLLLLDGKITESFLRYPALLPLLFTFLLLVLHLVFKFEHGARWLVISFSITAFLIAINFSIRVLIFGSHYA